jgi:hypothetical protein
VHVPIVLSLVTVNLAINNGMVCAFYESHVHRITVQIIQE